MSDDAKRLDEARVTTRHTDGAIALLRELNGGHEPYAPAVGFVQRWLANWEAAALAAARREAFEEAMRECDEVLCAAVKANDAHAYSTAKVLRAAIRALAEGGEK